MLTGNKGKSEGVKHLTSNIYTPGCCCRVVGLCRGCRCFSTLTMFGDQVGESALLYHGAAATHTCDGVMQGKERIKKQQGDEDNQDEVPLPGAASATFSHSTSQRKST